jgi:hypothetical protein
VINCGSGGGHFEDDHVFFANAYMVKKSDFQMGDDWYGNDTVRDVYYEELGHFILSGDRDGVYCYNNVQGHDQGGIAYTPPKILVDTITLTNGAWRINHVAQGDLPGTVQPTMTFQNPLAVAGPVQATGFKLAPGWKTLLCGGVLLLGLLAAGFALGFKLGRRSK